MIISLIIPSFNQAQFIEETLHSILSQEHSDLEVLVVDGGSQDSTVSILRRISDRRVRWESEPDRGQTHAINKGLAQMTGEVWAYVNSDDLLMPGALKTVAGHFSHPEVMWLGGVCENFDVSGVIGGVVPGKVTRQKDYLSPWNRPSQFLFPFSGACFMRRQVVEKIGLFDESFHFSMDGEYYCRAIFEGGFRQTLIPDVLAKWRWHAESKTMSRGLAYAFRQDEVRLAEKCARYLSAAEQEELQQEIAEQKKWLAVREAMWLLEEGERVKALQLLRRAAWQNPAILGNRPWLGAVRRCIVA